MPDFSTRPLRVFLCHSSGDKPAVRNLYHQLCTEGWIDVWLDESKLLPGQEWDLEIETAVEAADVVIVFLSTRSVDKEGYVQKELRYVLNIADEKPEGSIFVIPLKLDDCVVPRRLRHWQWVDYFPEEEKRVAHQRLLQSLKLRAAKLGISLSEPGPSLHPVINTGPIVVPVKAPTNESAEIPEDEPRAENKPGVPFVNQHKQSDLKQTKQNSYLIVSGILGGTLIFALCVWGGSVLYKNIMINSPEPTNTPSANVLPTSTSTTDLVSRFVTQSIIAERTTTPSVSWPTSDILTNQSGIVKVAITPTFSIGSTIISEKDGMSLLYVPAGEFVMGGETEDGLAECQRIRSGCKLNSFQDEAPQHTVVLKAFWIDKTEITNIMYSKCVDGGSCTPPSSRSSSTRFRYYGNFEFNNYPVIYVSWNAARTYCEWANRRLPTEAEWEKAARGENGNIYPWGNNFDSARTNFCDKNCLKIWTRDALTNVFSDTSPVGYFQNGASVYGVLDMSGNVWEWVSSLAEPYPYNSIDGREDLNVAGARMIRGGSWYGYGYPSDVRALVRSSYFPTVETLDLGFRCAMSAAP